MFLVFLVFLLSNEPSMNFRIEWLCLCELKNSLWVKLKNGRGWGELFFDDDGSGTFLKW